MRHTMILGSGGCHPADECKDLILGLLDPNPETRLTSEEVTAARSRAQHPRDSRSLTAPLIDGAMRAGKGARVGGAQRAATYVLGPLHTLLRGGAWRCPRGCATSAVRR